MNENSGTSMLCEQGDLGLWNTPVNEKDQQKLQEAATEETKVDK